MAGGGWKPRESEEKLGTFVTSAQQGGSRPVGVLGVLHLSDSGGLALWVGDLGINVADGEGPGQFPVQGRESDHWETAMAKEGRDMDIPANGRNNEGYGNGGNTDLNSPEAEYGRTIHCDAANSGLMRTGHLAARRAGVLVVVGTDGDRTEGSAREGDGSSGGNGNRSGSRVRGRSGRGRGRKRRGGVPGSERVQWRGVERGGG